MEEVEDLGISFTILSLVFNIYNQIDVQETEDRIAEYQKNNLESIKKNKAKQVLGFS